VPTAGSIARKLHLKIWMLCVRRGVVARGMQAGLTVMLVFSVLAAGCAGRVEHELPPGYAISADTRNGVVIGSIGARPAAETPPWHEWSSYRYRSLDDPAVAGSITSAFKWNPYYMWGSMPLCADDGLEEECGRVFALLLPAGEYEFSSVGPAMMDEATSSQIQIRHQPLSGYRFSVRAGETVYVGNLLSRVCITGTRFRGGNAPWAAVGDVADRAERDIPLILSRYPILRDVVPARRPMRGERWLWRHPKLKSEFRPAGCSGDTQEQALYLRGDETPG